MCWKILSWWINEVKEVLIFVSWWELGLPSPPPPPCPCPVFYSRGLGRARVIRHLIRLLSLRPAGRVGRERRGWQPSAPVVKWLILHSLLSPPSNISSWMFFGMKADKHMFAYICGQVKKQGPVRSHGLTQREPVRRWGSKSVFSCHPLWEGRLDPSRTYNSQSSQNLLNSYCGRPRSPRRHQGTAISG